MKSWHHTNSGFARDVKGEFMKVCPKCNKGMKKALQVMETEATWWEEEGFYVAQPNGKHRVYEKCLVCGTELAEEVKGNQKDKNFQGSEGEVKIVYEKVNDKLRKLEKHYNPKEENLHFYALERADAKLFSTLSSIGKKGLKISKLPWKEKHFDVEFSFWYEFFLITSSAALGVKKAGFLKSIPGNILKKLVELLVDISEVSVKNGGDLQKRNYEALGNILFAFYDRDLIEIAYNRSQKIGSSQVNEFIASTI